MNAQSTELIFKMAERTAGELFSLLQVRERPQVRIEEEGTLAITLTLEDPKALIGERGQTLFEIQHLLRSMMRKQLQQNLPAQAGSPAGETDLPHVFLDINDYRKSKEEYLRQTARQAADETVLLNKPRELPSMSAAERRVVHMELSKRADVISESVGEGTERRIIIKPKAP